MKFANRNNSRQGFTLIEMVGVLAIIAILAALLVPKIFAAINESRINNAVVSVNSVKAAAMGYFGKYGRFAGVAGAALAPPPAANAPFTDWDAKVLLADGYLERDFAVRVGTSADVVAALALPATTAATFDNSAYDLDSNTTSPSLANEASSGACVIECVLTGVPLEDAREMNLRIDGGTVSETTTDPNNTPTDTTDDVSGDIKGRVKYKINVGVADVRVYIAHK